MFDEVEPKNGYFDIHTTEVKEPLKFDRNIDGRDFSKFIEDFTNSGTVLMEKHLYLWLRKRVVKKFGMHFDGQRFYNQ